MTALIAPTAIPYEIVQFDSLVMLAMLALSLALAWTRYRISRLEGYGLVAGYAVYLFAIWPR